MNNSKALRLAPPLDHCGKPTLNYLRNKNAFTLAEGTTHVDMSNNIRRVAFTLAEVLITLGIIGVVAAMTMPSLIANQKEKETVTRLKKAYSVMSQALIFATNENGTPDNWQIGDYSNEQGAKNIINNLAPYLNITENCVTTSSCLGVNNYKLLDGRKYTDFDTNRFSEVKLTDGTYIMALASSNNCTGVSGTSEQLKQSCAFLYVDTNGDRKPNQLGKDFFEFIMTKNAIIPSGSEFAESETFYTNCLNKTAGHACTAWALYNENLDYLKCNDLSWTGKTKCE